MQNIKVKVYSNNLTLFTLQNVKGIGGASPFVELYRDQTIAAPAICALGVNSLKEFALGLLEIVDIIEAGEETINDLNKG